MTEFSRRGFLAAGGGAALSLGLLGCSGERPPARMPTVAITMDDFSIDNAANMPVVVRNGNILGAMAAHNVKGAAFVTGNYVNSDVGKTVVKSWADAGHMLGNHTFTHLRASETDVAAYKTDILKNSNFLKPYPTTSDWFRYPYLDEGGREDPAPENETKDARRVRLTQARETRDAYREMLSGLGLRNAAVTLETSDWYISQKLDARLRDNPNADVSAYGRFYINHVRKSGLHFQAVARDLGLDGIGHTMLVHYNELNGLFLRDLMDTLKSEGWNFVDAQTVFKQEVFSLKPRSLNQGRGLLSVMEREAATVGKDDKDKHLLRRNPSDLRGVKWQMKTLGL